MSPFATHDPGVSDVTEVTPSLSVAIAAVNDLPTKPSVGKFEIVKVEGVNLPTLKD
jgi:hypothetical protein